MSDTTTDTIPTPATDWAELAATDASLQAYVAAEIARRGIAQHVADLELRHWKELAERLDEQVKGLKEQLKAIQKGETQGGQGAPIGRRAIA